MARWLNACSQLPYDRRDSLDLTSSPIHPRRQTWELNDCNKTAGVALFNTHMELYKKSEGILGCYTYTKASHIHIEAKAWCQLVLSCCVSSNWLYGSLTVLCRTGGSQREVCYWMAVRWIYWETSVKNILQTLARCSYWDLRYVLHLTGWPALRRDANKEQRKKSTSLFPKQDLDMHLTFKLFHFHSTTTRRNRHRLFRKN